LLQGVNALFTKALTGTGWDTIIHLSRKNNLFERFNNLPTAPFLPSASVPEETVASATFPRALLFSPLRDAADVLGRTLQAVGCRVRFCDAESAVLDALQSGPWDVFLHEPERTPESLEIYEKVLRSAPRTRLWIILPPEAPREPLERRLAEAGRAARIFQKPLLADAVLKALQEDGGGAAWPFQNEARVLLADPDGGFCEAVLDCLSLEGYRGRTARSGAEAIAEAGRQFYHVALADVRLPDMTVWDLARRLHEINPNLVVIALADHASLDMVLHALRADVYDYLLKPLDNLAFRRTLRKALDKQRMGLQIQSLLEGLTNANRDLVHLNELKNRFLRIVSHDLRTPLTAVKGYSQALKAGMIPPERYEKCFNTMVKECEHLEHLIGDLVDFVSIEAGKMRLEKAPLEPRAVFEPVVERFRDAMDRAKVSYRVEGLGVLPLILADARRLDQVLSNLIGNALKHTPEGGAVTVAFGREGSALSVRVTDSGEGLLPEHLARVFDQFFQVESAMNQRAGLGLGLHIAKDVVHRHGGEIGVESDGLGKGATFWFTVPFMTRPKGR
jgi:signal transduction histidine kinase